MKIETSETKKIDLNRLNLGDVFRTNPNDNNIWMLCSIDSMFECPYKCVRLSDGFIYGFKNMKVISVNGKFVED